MPTIYEIQQAKRGVDSARIKEFLAKYKITSYRLAKLLEVEVSTVSLWVNRKRNIRPTIFRFLELLGADFDRQKAVKKKLREFEKERLNKYNN